MAHRNYVFFSVPSKLQFQKAQVVAVLWLHLRETDLEWKWAEAYEIGNGQKKKKESCPFLPQSRQQQVAPSHSAFWPISLFHYFDFGMTSAHV